MRITRRVEFAASHVCRLAHLSDEENERLYGEDARPHGHGHNFVVEVTLEGQPDPVTGMVFDLKALKRLLDQEVVEPFDHRHLNLEVPPFDRLVPTPENIAIVIWQRLEPYFRNGQPKLTAVRVYETDDCYVEYRGQ